MTRRKKLTKKQLRRIRKLTGIGALFMWLSFLITLAAAPDSIAPTAQLVAATAASLAWIFSAPLRPRRRRTRRRK